MGQWTGKKVGSEGRMGVLPAWGRGGCKGPEHPTILFTRGKTRGGEDGEDAA